MVIDETSNFCVENGTLKSKSDDWGCSEQVLWFVLGESILILEDTERPTLEKPSLSTPKGSGGQRQTNCSHSSLVNNDWQNGKIYKRAF